VRTKRMRIFSSIKVILITLLTVLSSSALAKPEKVLSPTVEVVLETEQGNIVLEVYQSLAPKTSAYFLGFIDRGDYNGASFYRSSASKLSANEPSGIIQGGVLYEYAASSRIRSMKETGYSMLQNYETTKETGLAHQYAMVSFARDLFESGAAIPDIFICQEDLPKFNAKGGDGANTNGFPVFAKVIKGMDVVKVISAQQSTGPTAIKFLEGQILSKPVMITKAYRK
jgi:peptidyl-prolyl cis-trans isomerase A (cyclophilin A)